MGASITTARDEILTLFRTAWLANSDSSSVPIFYADAAQAPPDGDSPYVVIRVQHESGRPSSLSGGLGAQKFSRQGTIRVAIYTPQGDGLTRNDELTQVAMDAFVAQDTASGIWFSGVVGAELGHENDMFVTEVRVGFRYTEFK